MKNAILLHGWPQKDEYYSLDWPPPNQAHWFPWLQKQLLVKDIYAEVPLMPDAYEPDYEKWKKAVERCDHIGPDTLIVGHSCGGGFWVRYLSENKDIRVGKVVLVAPWIDPDGILASKFHADYKIDPDVATRTDGITIFTSDNDNESVLRSVKLIRQNVTNAHLKEFPGYGHFCKEDINSNEFPELLEELLR
jgi:predicted alpha/beta hydrolase family esterase